MNKTFGSYLKIGVFTVFFIIVDQLTKYWATIALKAQNDFIIIKNILHFHFLDGGNTGAAWGIFSGRISMFIIFTIIAVIFIIIFIRNIQTLLSSDNYSLNIKALKILQYSMALLMAGAVGNLIDRITLGYVIDFIYFKLINFPIFNVADCYVTIACIVIVLVCFFKIKETVFNQIFTLRKSNK